MNDEEIIRKSLKELANSIFSKLDDVEKTYLVMVNNEKNKQINELQQELQRKDNLINELEEWLLNHYEVGNEIQNEWNDDVLDKIKDIENAK